MNCWYLIVAAVMLAAVARALQPSAVPPVPDKRRRNGLRLYRVDDEFVVLRADQIEGGLHP